MSELVVEVCRIESVEKHPNADSLSLARVKGWNVCFNHDSTAYAPGDEALYVPPDTLIPAGLAEEWGVANYLSFPKSEPDWGRVQSVRLRGIPSHGFLVDADGLQRGVNVASELGLRKWEPPVSISAGDEDRPIEAFHKYTSIENWRHYPDIIQPGEEVIITEKIHGTNARVGLVFDDRDLNEWAWMIGSHNTRKKLETGSLYQTPLTENVKDLLILAHEEYGGAVILFGEIYGRVQDLRYGLQNSTAFVAFDLSVNGEYLPFDRMAERCSARGVPVVPVLYRGPMPTGDRLAELASGKTTMMAEPGKKDIREGVVIRPTKERFDPTIGRVILKYVSDDYLTRGGGSEAH